MTRYARAGAAKKAAGCGEEARGASLSYLEPFPVDLGPPLSVYIVVVCYAYSSPAPSQRTSATRMHSRTRVHARATLQDRAVRPFPARVHSTSHLVASAARCCEPDNHFSLDDRCTNDRVNARQYFANNSAYIKKALTYQ